MIVCGQTFPNTPREAKRDQTLKGCGQALPDIQIIHLKLFQLLEDAAKQFKSLKSHLHGMSPYSSRMCPSMTKSSKDAAKHFQIFKQSISTYSISKRMRPSSSSHLNLTFMECHHIPVGCGQTWPNAQRMRPSICRHSDNPSQHIPTLRGCGQAVLVT